MEELLKFLKQISKVLETTIKDNSDTLKNDNKQLKRIKSDPELIYEDNPFSRRLHKELTEYAKTNNDIEFLLKVLESGQYQEFKNQSQVVRAYGEYSKYIDKARKENEERFETVLKNVEKSYKLVQKAIDAIKNYNPDKYYTEEDLKVISDVYSDLKESINRADYINNLIRLYNETLFEILRNNSIIEYHRLEEKKKAKVARVTPIVEQPSVDVDMMLQKRVELNETRETQREILSVKQQYIEKIKKILSDEEFFKDNTDILDKISIILNETVNVLDNNDNIDFEFVDSATSIDAISWFEDSELYVVFAKFVIDSYENHDVNRMTDLINMFRNNKSNDDIKLFFELYNLSDYVLLLDKIEGIIFDSNNNKYKLINSYSDLSMDIISSTFESLNKNDPNYYKNAFSYLWISIYKTISNRNIDENTLAVLSQLYSVGTNLYNEYTSDESIDEIQKYYGPNPENYIVFYDGQQFLESFIKTVESLDEKDKNSFIKDVIDKLEKLKRLPIATLISEKESHCVRIGKNDNIYNIMSLRNKAARITYKIIEYSGINDGHEKSKPVIILFDTFYGIIDRYEKNRKLNQSISMFTDQMPLRYGISNYEHDDKDNASCGLLKTFNKKNNVDGISVDARLELEDAIKIIKEIEKYYAPGSNGLGGLK